MSTGPAAVPPDPMKVLGIVKHSHAHGTGLTRHAVRVSEDRAARGDDDTVASS